MFRSSFIELPKFKPQSFAEKKMAVLWLKFLTEINEKTRVVPPELLENPEVSKALEIVEESAYSKAEMAAYDGFWDAVRIEATIMGGLNRARIELAEERKLLVAAKAERDAATAERDAATAERDAAVEKLRQTARKMKSKGFSVADIVDFTGLTPSEIAAL